ncbi:MAG: hypothetical protein GX145_01075 [Clostridiaceae bacterium]|jgi:uncharacterized protein YaaQ|nr:cyclic-di-AMP receptor [Bacillota bacterium]NLN51391.1 hypothetical protein [Clostridiaceae bacterium]
MKLILAIVNDEDTSRLVSELNKAGFRVTKLSSTGGFLRSGNTTLIIGVENHEVDDALGIVRKNSSSRKATINTTMSPTGMGTSYLPYPVEVNIGGATVFIIDVDHYERM